MSSCVALLANSKTAAKTDCHLLRGIVESLIDGVLIVTADGAWVYGNQIAHQMCCRLSMGQPMPGRLPHPIWKICQRLLSSSCSSVPAPAVIESEVLVERTVNYRVRVQWLALEDAQKPYLLITIEDCYQALFCRAIAEAQEYALTARQAEVWRLHRTGYTYREIAETLFVSLNTVKRHMKDIYSKQKGTSF